MSETPNPTISESEEQLRRYTDPKIGEMQEAIKKEGVVETEGIGKIRKRLPKSSALSQQVTETQQRKISEITEKIIALKKLAETDELTGIANRRGFYEIAPEILAKSQKSNVDTVVFMIDLDHFKQVNDKWGHTTGDIVLQTFAQSMKNTFREPDLNARVGGEEFAVLLTGLKAEDALNVAKRLDNTFKELINSSTDLSEEFKKEGCRLSIGATEVTEEDFENGIPQIKKIIQRADSNLYRVKESGRNGLIIDNNEPTKLREAISL
jgi:diguanylate cyclase (GGDEF)-like protein